MDQGYGNLAWECVCAWMTRDLWKSNSYLWVEGACQLTWKIWFAGLRAAKGYRLVKAEGSWLVPEACGTPRDETPASAWLGRPHRPPDNGRAYSRTGRRRPGETEVSGWGVGEEGEIDRTGGQSKMFHPPPSGLPEKGPQFNPFSSLNLDSSWAALTKKKHFFYNL